VDVVEPPVLFALQKDELTVVDGQQLMQEARLIKMQDEITLLAMACSMVDAASDELYRFMRPGVRENECVGLVNNVLYSMGSEHVEGVNAISGERCNPHPHIFSDRVLRPGDLAFYDILQSFNGYRTCYYRTLSVGSASRAQIDAYKRCRYYLDIAIKTIKPGVTTADVVKLWPRSLVCRTKNLPLPFSTDTVSAWQFGEAGLQPPRFIREPRSHSRLEYSYAPS